MNKVIFIDRGNILRSPLAKALYNKLADNGSVAFSYGTDVVEQGKEGLILENYPGMVDAIQVMKDHGMDISKEQCQQLLPEHLKGAYKIIVMTEKEDIPAWLKAYPYEYWEVPNPDPVTAEVAEKEITLLKEKISSLLLIA